MLTCNYLTVLVKPTYDKPFDTSEEVIAAGLTIIGIPGTEANVKIMEVSDSHILRAIAAQTYTPKVTRPDGCERHIDLNPSVLCPGLG